MNRLSTNLMIAGAMIVVSLILVTCRKMGLIDGDTVTRAYLAGMGLYVMASANLIPKTPGPVSGRILTIRRIVARIMLAGGFGFALSGLFAPTSIAPMLSAGLLFAAVIGIFTYCLWGRAPRATT